MANLDELRDTKLFDLADKLRLPDNEFEEWLKNLGLFHLRQIYDRCGNNMKATRNMDKKIWVCHVEMEEPEPNLRKDT